MEPRLLYVRRPLVTGFFFVAALAALVSCSSHRDQHPVLPMTAMTDSTHPQNGRQPPRELTGVAACHMFPSLILSGPELHGPWDEGQPWGDGTLFRVKLNEDPSRVTLTVVLKAYDPTEPPRVLRFRGFASEEAPSVVVSSCGVTIVSMRQLNVTGQE